MTPIAGPVAVERNRKPDTAVAAWQRGSIGAIYQLRREDSAVLPLNENRPNTWARGTTTISVITVTAAATIRLLTRPWMAWGACPAGMKYLPLASVKTKPKRLKKARTKALRLDAFGIAAAKGEQ